MISNLRLDLILNFFLILSNIEYIVFRKLFGEIPSQLIKSIEIIVSKYRNPSAHIGEISKSDADMFLEEYKKLMNGLFKSFSKIKP